MEELCKNIVSENFETTVKSTDVKYEYINLKNKENKNEIREQRIIVFGSKESLKNLNNKEVNEYFVDVTFKSIPKKFWPYKLLTISCFNQKDKITKICCFACIKYLDKISYYKVFSFLKEIFSFKPKIIHTDYEAALQAALKEKDLFQNPVLHTFCFFHFSKAIKEQMKKISIIKKNMTKYSLEILRNIEIICFININKVKDYIKYLSEKLEANEETKKLFNYLNKNWFSKNYELFNYQNLINFRADIDDAEDEKISKYIYFTNNVAESLHRRIDFYLPKQITKSNTFIETFKKILINNELKRNSVERYDYNSKTLIEIIDKENLNDNFKWITLDIYFKYQKIIIEKDKKNNLAIDDLKKIIENINYINNENDTNSESNEELEIIDKSDKINNEKNSSQKDDADNEQDLIKEYNNNERDYRDCIESISNFHNYDLNEKINPFISQRRGVYILDFPLIY